MQIHARVVGWHVGIVKVYGAGESIRLKKNCYGDLSLLQSNIKWIKLYQCFNSHFQRCAVKLLKSPLNSLL